MSSRRFGSQSLVRLLGHWQQTSSRTPRWRQLADALRLLILDGRLALNTRLPGERELAAALDVSRTTISSALVSRVAPIERNWSPPSTSASTTNWRVSTATTG